MDAFENNSALERVNSLNPEHIGPGLYVHIPFCRSKCPYCAFYSIPSMSLVPIWLDAFEEECARYKNRLRQFDSLYIGGGTPTVLDTRTLHTIMDALYTHFTFDANIEITIEANPCDLTSKKIKALKEMGANRISLGVQSFNDRILTFLGRCHSAIQAKKAIEDLRNHGFENISMDLIYGLNAQKKTDWINTLKTAISFHPEHLSCYQLTIEKKTVFGRLKEKGLFEPVDEKKERDLFIATSQFFEDHGYIQYEVSSFAKSKTHYSRHNSKYWDHTPYLGLGPSAHSFDGLKRWWNVASIRKYCDALAYGRSPIEGDENLTEEQLRVESIMLGLRTKNGVNLENIIHSHHFDKILAEFQDSGFLFVDGGRVLPTQKGFLMADYLAACLTT